MANQTVNIGVPSNSSTPLLVIDSRLGVNAGGTPDGDVKIGIPAYTPVKIVTIGGRLGVDLVEEE